MIQLIRDNFSKYWFYVSAALVGILWFLLNRKEKQLSKALADAQFQILQNRLIELNEKAKESNDSYLEARKEYEDIKRNHGDLLTRLGVLDNAPKKGTND